MASVAHDHAATAPAAPTTNKSTISMMTMTVMIITTIVSLRGLASQAEFGWASIFYYLFAAVFFLIPFALVCAELASTFTKKGGIFRWCGEAFGGRWGFTAMFLEWATIIVWFPSVLIFGAVALAYSLRPETFDNSLANNKWYTLAVLLVVYWLSTLNSFRGIKSSALVSKWGGIIGTIIPGIVLIILGGIWWIKGEKIEMAGSSFLPDLSSISNLVLAASIFLFYAGMEMQAVHVNNMTNPRKQFPKAIFLSSIFIVFIFIVATLAIAVAVPREDISLTQSLLVAYNTLWASIGLSWMGEVMAVMVAIGVIGQVAVIIAGPSTGMLQVGKAGYLPPKLQETNKHDIQVPIILLQGVVVTILSLAIVVLPSVETAYQMVTQMATINYLMMCIIIYGSFIYLRKKYPVHVLPRGYKVPGGEGVAWFVAIFGIVGVLLALGLSFVPPDQIATGSPAVYVGILIAGAIVFLGIPLLVYQMRKPDWNNPNSGFEPFGELGVAPVGGGGGFHLHHDHKDVGSAPAAPATSTAADKTPPAPPTPPSSQAPVNPTHVVRSEETSPQPGDKTQG